jgi:hypothetical protein
MIVKVSTGAVIHRLGFGAMRISGARNREGVRGRREGRGELTHPVQVGGIERARPPDIGAAGADSRKQAATGNQSHAGRCGRRPGPAALPRPLTCLDREQRRQRLGERDEIR